MNPFCSFFFFFFILPTCLRAESSLPSPGFGTAELFALSVPPAGRWSPFFRHWSYGACCLLDGERAALLPRVRLLSQSYDAHPA